MLVLTPCTAAVPVPAGSVITPLAVFRAVTLLKLTDALAFTTMATLPEPRPVLKVMLPELSGVITNPVPGTACRLTAMRVLHHTITHLDPLGTVTLLPVAMVRLPTLSAFLPVGIT